MLNLPMYNPGGMEYSNAIAKAIGNAVKIVFGTSPAEGYGLYMDVLNGRIDAKLKDIIDIQRVHNFMEMSGIEDKPITIRTKDGNNVDIDPEILLWALAAETIMTVNNWVSKVTELQASFIAFLFRFLASQNSLYLLGYADNIGKGCYVDYVYVENEKYESNSGEHPLLIEKDPVFFDLIHNVRVVVHDTIQNSNSPRHEFMDADFIDLAMEWCKKNQDTKYFTMHWDSLDEKIKEKVKNDRVLKYKAAATAMQHIDSMGINFPSSIKGDLFIAYSDAIVDHYIWILEYLYSIDSDNDTNLIADCDADDTHMLDWTFEDENYTADDYLEYLGNRFPIGKLIYSKKSLLFGKKKMPPFANRLRRFGCTEEDLWHISCVCELEGFIHAAS